MTELPATFGKYYLTEKIAVGGMAEIYLAKLLGPGGFEKQLIIKQIHPELTGQPQFVDLFVTEAKTLVNLTHGNIVPVYELGVVEDRYFIAMEYIDGPTLNELQIAVAKQDVRVSPPIAAYICAELLKGLDYAHRKGEGVIHRDLSPRNVMLSREGEVKLVDFGIAVALDDQPRHGGAGRPEGSFPYMSPEQVRSEKLSGQSDLFSVGVLLWETLTGCSLFAREDADRTLSAVLEADIAVPSMYVPEIDAELDDIAMRALERDPAARFASASEFLTRLSRYLYSLDAVPSPAVLSRMVARYCPPTARRRIGTNTEDGTPPPGTPRFDRTTPHAGPNGEDPVDRTVPVARPGGKRAGTKTFATSVQFERDVLARATPLFPIKAITDEDLAGLVEPHTSPPATTEDEPAGESAPAPTAAEKPTPEKAAPGKAAPAPPPPSRRGTWAALAAIAAAGAVAAVVLVPRLRGGSSPSSAAADAAVIAVPPDASLADAAVPDAGSTDAGVPDARPVRRRPDAAAVRGTATLKVGANPWAEVYLDGRKLGRAPGQWTVPAGDHVLVVKFPVPGREQEQRFPIELAPSGTLDLGTLDFTDR